MTTTDIHDWKGTEFVEEFTDFVLTGTLEAKAIASRQTGRMVNSVKIRKVRDGFEVYSDRNDFPPTKRGKVRYYTKVYVEKGYPNYPPFDFLMEGFQNVGEGELVKGGVGQYSAKVPSGRRGSGTAILTQGDKSAVTAYRERAENRLAVKIPKRLQK